jgi:hypothetical protein
MARPGCARGVAVLPTTILSFGESPGSLTLRTYWLRLAVAVHERVSAWTDSVGAPALAQRVPSFRRWSRARVQSRRCLAGTTRVAEVARAGLVDILPRGRAVAGAPVSAHAITEARPATPIGLVRRLLGLRSRSAGSGVVAIRVSRRATVWTSTDLVENPSDERPNWTAVLACLLGGHFRHVKDHAAGSNGTTRSRPNRATVHLEGRSVVERRLSTPGDAPISHSDSTRDARRH